MFPTVESKLRQNRPQQRGLLRKLLNLIRSTAETYARTPDKEQNEALQFVLHNTIVGNRSSLPGNRLVGIEEQ